ncbi:MAG: DUF115 domain-containing protein [Acidobacteriota bacterium]|nr:DUF115 domain-containing protein [Acidobacteriota bacterium]
MAVSSLEIENRDILSKRDPHLLLELSAEHPTGAAVVDTASGEPTLVLNDHFLHHPEDPVAEAVEKVGRAPKKLHLHFGFGLGYFMGADQPREDGRLIIYEPRAEFIETAMKTRPVGRELIRKNADVCCSFDRFCFLAMRCYSGCREYRLFVSARHAEAFPDELAAFQEFLQNLSAAMVSVKTSRLFPTIMESTVNSLSHHLAEPDAASWRDRLKGKPAVIVAAGPSLDKNLDQLKAVRSNAVVFAIGRTAKALEAQGIDPDFLVHVEAQDFSRFIEGCNNLADTHFLLADQAHTDYYRFPHGDTYVFQSRTNPIINSLVNKHPEARRLIIKTGGSVATAAWFLAWTAGCNPLVLIGQDLALTGNRWYGGPGNEEKGIRGSRKVKGYHGGMVTTVPNFHNNIIWYQRSVEVMRKQDPTRIFINATEGGARLEGMEHLSFAEAAERYLTRPVSITRPEPVGKCFSEREVKSFLNGLTQFLGEMDLTIQGYRRTEQALLKRLATGEPLADLEPEARVAAYLAPFQRAPHFAGLLKPEYKVAQLLQKRLEKLDPDDRAGQIRLWASLGALHKGRQKLQALVGLHKLA